MRQQRKAGKLSPGNVLRTVTERVKQIDYDFSSFTIQDFAQWVADKRGFDIHLEPCDELTAPTGFWFLSDDGAHVKYSGALNQTLMTITILHELMHIYLGHETKYIPANRALLECCQRIATRNPSQQNMEDQEAETAAVLIYQRASEVERANTNPVLDLFGQMD